MEKRDFTTNATSPLPSAPIQGHNGILLAFHILHLIGGQVLLPILLITLFIGGEARKNPLLANFCFSWILLSGVELILFYGGKTTSETPTIQVCLIQAALSYGVMAMTAITSCAIVIQAWHYLRMSTRPNGSVRIYGWQTTVLITLSYLALIGYSSAGIIIGVDNPQDIGRNHNFFVCDIQHHELATAVGWLCGAVGLIALILGIWIIVIIYHNRQTIRYWQLYHTSSDFAMILRTLVFIGYGMMIVISSIVAIFGINTTFVYVYTAILPTVAFIVFGTRHSTTKHWRKWLRLPQRSRRTPNTRYSLVNDTTLNNVEMRTFDPQHQNDGDQEDSKDKYRGYASQNHTRPRQPQSRPSEMAMMELEAEADDVDILGPDIPLRTKTGEFVRADSQQGQDSWGYKSNKGKEREEGNNNVDNVHHVGPTLRRGWSQAPEIDDGPYGSLRTQPISSTQDQTQQRSGSWEELTIASPPRAPPLPHTNTMMSTMTGNNNNTTTDNTHLPRPTIASYTSSFSTSTARHIPRPEETDLAELLPDGDKSKRLKRPANISWKSEPYLPVALRFARRNEEEWDGPY